MLLSSEDKKQGALKIKFTVIVGYLLVVLAMALGLMTLYCNLVDYSNKRMCLEDLSQLLIVGNTLSLLYEIESEQNLMNVESAEQYFLKYDSIIPKIRTNLNELKQLSADSSRTAKLDTIQLLMDRKRENLQEIAVLLDSIHRTPKIAVRTENSYSPKKLQQEISRYVEDREKSNISDTTLVAGAKKGLFNRLLNVFAARPDSILVIENKSVVSESKLQVVIDTIINKIRYMERLDLERQKRFQQAYFAHQEMLNETNRMLTLRINDLLNRIEQEELEKSIQLLREKEQTLVNSQRAISAACFMALLFAFVFAILFLTGINRSQRYRTQLEASHKRISDLLASREVLMFTISHDIRAPMSSILGFIELMNTHGDRKNETYLANMKNSSEHILELASALLDYHKLEKGNWLLKELNFDLHALINNTASGFEPLAVRKGLKYTVENDLPEHLFAYSDPYMLRQIMSNLISNAIKYTQEGSIRVGARCNSPKRLLFSVTDTGAGIDAADQQFIFQEFKQLDNPVGEEGCGLGLAITKGFVRALEGTIRLNSRKGEGAEFIVEIPLKDAREEVQEQEQEQEQEEFCAAQQDLEGISVLFVDDDAMQLMMVSEMLARKKIHSVTEENPDKVLSLLRSESFDILFMDIRMPGTDGLALLEKVRQLEGVKDMPVIGLSARLDISKEKMKDAGFTDFFTKPITSGKLYGIIRKYVCGGTLVEDVPVEKGFCALIDFVRDDKYSSFAILQSFIDETGKGRVQLEKALRDKDENMVRGIVHKIAPMFRLIGDKPLTAFMERMEKGECLSDGEQLLVLDKIDGCLQEAEIFKTKIIE
jgi:signal transduction histidine kinase/CheY-like chemotaxis protein